MKHILDCTKEEAKTFLIEKEYKGHSIRIKTKDSTRYQIPYGKNMMEVHNTPNPFNLYVFFQLFSGLEINLGQIVQELAEDDIGLNYWIEERLLYLADYMTKI